jgi:hypothetical protein
MWVAAPGVHRMHRSSHLTTKAIVSVLAAAAAGACAGAITGLVGQQFSPGGRIAVVMVGSAAVVVAPLARLSLPQRDRETPQRWLNYGPVLWSLANGGTLGLAVTTRIGFWLWYLVPLGAFAAGWRDGAAIWALYSTTRLLVIVAIGWRMQSPSTDVGAITSRLLTARPAVRVRASYTAAATGLALVLLLGFAR